ncbi:hypothetical protein AGMMS49579_01040 [Spirochaetia bacterium]|nr:hypothetical protein AGMMS49579_01040 [Spirochaetia bacterium]
MDFINIKTCSKGQFRETYDCINKLKVNHISIIISKNMCYFFIKGQEEISTFETNLLKIKSYWEDINNIIYEPSDIVMPLHDIIDQPYILSAHIYNIQKKPRFKIVFGMEKHQKLLYLVPIKNTFIEESELEKSMYVYNHFNFNLGKFSQNIILWDYCSIEMTSLHDHSIYFKNYNKLYLDSDKVIPKDKIGTDVCKICFKNGVNTLFIPCMHVVSCQKCSIQLGECHICKTYIINKVRIFMS